MSIWRRLVLRLPGWVSHCNPKRLLSAILYFPTICPSHYNSLQKIPNNFHCHILHILVIHFSLVLHFCPSTKTKIFIVNHLCFCSHCAQGISSEKACEGVHVYPATSWLRRSAIKVYIGLVSLTMYVLSAVTWTFNCEPSEVPWMSITSYLFVFLFKAMKMPVCRSLIQYHSCGGRVSCVMLDMCMVDKSIR